MKQKERSQKFKPLLSTNLVATPATLRAERSSFQLVFSRGIQSFQKDSDLGPVFGIVIYGSNRSPVWQATQISAIASDEV